MKEQKKIKNSTAEFLIFTAQANEDSIEVRIEDENVWLTQKLIAKLFSVKIPTVNEHLRNLFACGELQKEATIRKFLIVQTEGNRTVSREIEHYNLEAIISIGFRVNSEKATHFRRWATHGQTAAELIMNRADHKKEFMGLTTWKKAPNGKIIKSDVVIAKNYLKEKEMKFLNRIVTMYLDYAEHQAEKGIPMTMEDWAEKLNAFLKFNNEDILQNAGKVTAEIAKAFAESEFEKYKPIQDRLFKSDFDKIVLEKLDRDVKGLEE